MDYTHQPCPIRIVDDCGAAFLMGTLGGGLFQCLKGFRNSPSGLRRRLYGGLDAVRMRTPAVACNFAVWGAVFTTVDCALVTYRRREDGWNSIISGTVTGGVLSARNGLRAMAGSAIAGFIFVSLLEGVSLLSNRRFTNNGGDSEDIPLEVFAHPQRIIWEPVDSSPKSSPEESDSLTGHKSTVEGSEQVLEKGQKQDAKADERRRDFLDLIKLAEFI